MSMYGKSKRRSSFGFAAVAVALLVAVAAGIIIWAPARAVPAGAEAMVWNDLSSWTSKNTTWTPNVGITKDEGSGNIVIQSKSKNEFGIGFSQPLYIDGIKIKFKLKKTGNNGNIKLAFCADLKWLENAGSAFTIDLAILGDRSQAGVTQNIKYPGSGNNIGIAKGGKVPDSFHWGDGTTEGAENTFEVKLGADGHLVFYINGFMIGCSSTNTGAGSSDSAREMETERLSALGVLDAFANGQGYFNVWHQSSEPIVMTVTEITQKIPVSVDGLAEQNTFVAIDDTGITTTQDGVGRLRFGTKEAATNYAVKNVNAVDLNQVVTKLLIGAGSGKKYGVFYDNKNDNKHNKQLRVYLHNKNSNNIEVATYDGSSETSIGTATVRDNSIFTSATNPDYSKSVEIRLKKLSMKWQLYINGKLVGIDLGGMTDFIQENFTGEKAYITLSNPADNPSAVIMFYSKTPASEAVPAEWKKKLEGDGIVTKMDEGKYQVFSTAADGKFQIYNDKTILWADAFGLEFHLDKFDMTNKDAVRLIISSVKDKWYADDKSPAFLIDFSINNTGGSRIATDVKVTAYTEEVSAAASTSYFNWNYADKNLISFGLADGEWILYVNERPLTLAGDGVQEAFQSEYEAFTSGLGYLQLENLGGQATSLSVSQAKYGIPVPSGPRGWLHGVNEVPPQWLATDGTVAFTSPGTSYSFHSGEGMFNINRFKFTLKAAPGKGDSNMTFAFRPNDGALWYTDTYSFGLYLSWLPEMGDSKINIGFMYGNKSAQWRGDTYVFIKQTPFNWYGENSFEIKKVKGAYSLLVNGNDVFAGSSNGTMTFDSCLKSIEEYFIDGQALIQGYTADGTSTYNFVEMTLDYPILPPNKVVTQISTIQNTAYEVGKEISIDLNTVFKDPNKLPMTFTADKGVVTGNIWTYTATEDEQLTVTFTANNGTLSSEPTPVIFNIEDEDSGDPKDPPGGCKGVMGIADMSVMLGLLFGGGAAVTLIKRKRNSINK